MKIKKFIKKNYKKLIIQFVSVISAFVLVSCPVVASNEIIIDGSKTWVTNISLRDNISDKFDDWGTVTYRCNVSNHSYKQTGHFGAIDSFDNYDGSFVPLNNNWFVITVLLDEPIYIEKHMSYTIELPLLFVSSFDYSYDNINNLWYLGLNQGIFTDKIKIGLYDINNYSESSEPYFCDYQLINGLEWKFTKNDIDSYTSSNKLLYSIKNYSDYSYQTKYIRMAINIDGSKLAYDENRTPFQLVSATGDGLGFYDNISITNNGKLYPSIDNSIVSGYIEKEQVLYDSTQQGFDDANNIIKDYDFDSNIANGLLGVTKIFNVFAGVSFIDGLLQFSLVIGVIAFVIGVSSLVGRIIPKK